LRENGMAGAKTGEVQRSFSEITNDLRHQRRQHEKGPQSRAFTLLREEQDQPKISLVILLNQL
jgi:hypothetical protein